MTPWSMLWQLGEQDGGWQWGECPLPPTIRHQCKASFFRLHLHTAPQPSPQPTILNKYSWPWSMWEFWRVRLSSPGKSRHQQKFISETHGYFENQISCSVAVKLGTFQVLLYNRNLFCLQLPYTSKNSISEREAIKVSSPHLCLCTTLVPGQLP